ncbi:MAG: hypothetical protein GF317_18425 [Candidatus Lokiarchaeota archaeon]|nr:hypothetical protein [Candidatus Lokiarchaeota archaeon]MBD3201492.1 hypothetical protein [Candidatus Lokiarchaeota archaeon]
MVQDELLKIFDNNLISRLADKAKDQIEYWDIRASSKEGSSVEFTDNKSKEISAYQINKCGIRTFLNGGWGFLVLENPNKQDIFNKFDEAIKLAKFSESMVKHNFKIKESDSINERFEIKSKKNLLDVGIEEKIELVKHHEKTSSTFNSNIKNTHTFYYDVTAQTIFVNSFGSEIKQDLSLLRIYNEVYAAKNGLVQRGRNSVGGLGGFEITTTDKAKKISKKSAKQATELLDAKSPIGGSFTLIMDPKLTGTFIHEAFGHACEADHILNKESILEGKIGKKVALDKVTIIDDPTMGKGKELGLPYELYGSYFVDDEGIPAQKLRIIEDGILKNYLHNLETASRMGEKPNGHGRASSSTSKPQVRMGITLLQPGDWKLDEIIEETNEGILCEDFQYGYTDPTSGNFQFKCKMSYKIENGEKRELMRDVALSGMTLEVLNRISAIGNKISYSDGMCGKGGQGVRVCDGGPYIRVEDITVGGLG